MTAAYLLALAVTLAIEVPVVSLLHPGERMRMALACVGATAATHLIMHHLLPPLMPSYTTWLVVGELMATLVEAFIYWLVSRRHEPGRALVASALANALSFGAGFFLF